MGSLLMRFDPRIKLLLLLELVVLFFLPIGVLGYAAAVSSVAVVMAVSFGWRQLAAPLKAILPLLVLVLVLTPLFYTQGAVLFSLGFADITDRGVYEALLLISRFTGITLSFSLMYQATKLQQFMLSLQWFGLPFTAALVMTLSFRYIPSISGMLQHVREAHRLRDPMIEEGKRKKGFLIRIQELVPILTSVVISSIKTIPSLAMSLEHRGIGSPRKRSRFEQLPPLHTRWKDVLAGCAAGFIMSIPFWI